MGRELQGIISLKLDWNPSNGKYILRVERGSADIQALIRDHGLDFSLPASTSMEAVLFTAEPYAAAAFADYATSSAAQTLAHIVSEIKASYAPDSAAHIACPPDKELWGFQKADIEYALRRTNTLVGDQPGLGKTPIAICFANEIRAKRALVICPASIRLQWVKRIREWTTMRWPYTIHAIMTSRNGVHPAAAWTVVSYEMARTESIHRALCKGLYDVIILDEAHYLKTPDARRTRAVFGGGIDRDIPFLAARAGSILALSGTPLVNRPREAFTIAHGLCPDAIDWMGEQDFQDRFNPVLKVKKEIIDPSTGKIRMVHFVDERTGRHAELQARLRANFMTRHEKHGPNGVMKQLHMPVYDLIQLEETKAVKMALDAENLLGIDPEELAGADIATRGHYAVVRREMGMALAPQVADYMDMLIDGGEEKLVLFAWHHEVMDFLETKLRRHGVRRVDGKTSSYEKAKRVKEFVEDPTVQIMLGNLQSLGLGTDGLQHVSSHALICEPSPVPGDNQQAFDRLDRGGQGRQVQCDIFVAPNSFAEKLLASSLRKADVIDRSLDRRL